MDSGRGQCSSGFLLLDSRVPQPQFPSRFQERSGSGRNHGAIIEKTQRLGLLKKENGSEAELQNVRDYCNLELQDFCAQFWQRLGLIRRSKHSKDIQKTATFADIISSTGRLKSQSLASFQLTGSTQSFPRYAFGTSARRHGRGKHSATHRQAKCDRRNQARRDPVRSWRSGQGQQEELLVQGS